MTRSLARLAGHSAIAMLASVVCVILSTIILGVVLRIFGLRSIGGDDSWYGPFVFWPGLLLGFFVNRRTLHRAACFVWLPGLIWLVVGMLERASYAQDSLSWWTQVRIELFPVGRSDCGSTECLGVAVYTWPAVNSVAYSIGAALVLLFKRGGSDGEEPTTESTTLGLD